MKKRIEEFQEIKDDQHDHQTHRTQDPKGKKVSKSSSSISFTQMNYQQYGENDQINEQSADFNRNTSNLINIICNHKYIALFVVMCFLLSYFNITTKALKYFANSNTDAYNNSTSQQSNLNITNNIVTLSEQLPLQQQNSSNINTNPSDIVSLSDKTQQSKQQGQLKKQTKILDNKKKEQKSIIIAQAQKIKLSDHFRSNYLPKQQQDTSQLAPPSVLKLTHSRQQLQQIIKQMQNPKDRPTKIRNVKKSTAKQDEVYFAFALSRQPKNKDYLQAEYYYYDSKYSIGKMIDQLPICAVVTGRNLGEGYHRMLNSLFRQNYTYFHVIFIDDNSQDGTQQNIRKYLQKNEYVSRKVTYIQQERRYALHNRNLGIRKYCKPGDIVIDVDADDWLIGKQVFKVINVLYQDPNLWACYFNNIIYASACKCPLMNSDAIIPQAVLEQNTYRVKNIWRTTELRTFRKDLFDKIDENDFIDQNGEFYKWKSDAFINFPIVQLAGPKHIRFYDEFFYFYDTSFSVSSPGKTYSRLVAKTQTPYNRLQSLKERATKVQNYKVPQKLIKKLQLQQIKMTK